MKKTQKSLKKSQKSQKNPKNLKKSQKLLKIPKNPKNLSYTFWEVIYPSVDLNHHCFVFKKYNGIETYIDISWSGFEKFTFFGDKLNSENWNTFIHQGGTFWLIFQWVGVPADP